MRLPPYAAISVALVIVAAASPRLASQTNGSAIPIFKHPRFISVNKTVNLDAIKSHVAFVHSKISFGFDNYRMNTSSTRRSPFSTVLQKRQDRVQLVGSAGQPWSAVITLGNVGRRNKKFLVSLDTASADTFLPDAKCDYTCDGHQRWDSVNSKTATSLKTKCSILYSDRTVISGNFFAESVSFASTLFNTPPQPVCSVRHYPQAYRTPGFIPDGVMGMAFPSISSYGATTVFQNLLSHGQVAAPVFSFQLLGTGGELYLGGINTELFSGDITYVPVVQRGFWVVEMDGIRAPGLSATPLGNGPAIIDTSSIFIGGPPSQVRRLQQVLGGIPAPNVGDGIYVFSCVLTPPDIAFNFGGTLFPLPGGSLNLGEVTAGSGICMSAVIAKDLIPGANLWVVGTPFLQNVYSTFDARSDHPQVGFAKLVRHS